MELEKRRLEEERQQREFEEGKQNTLGQTKDLTNSDLKPKDLTNLPELKAHETSIRIAYAGSGYEATLKRARCSNYLLHKANEHASAGDFNEAAYLSNEAADIMNGAKDSPDVMCPPFTDDVPPVNGGPVKQSVQQAEKLKKMTILYSKLFNQASQEIADYRAVIQNLKDAEEKLKQAQTLEQEAQAKEKDLETQKNQDPQSVQDSALAEALAALKQAQAALEQNKKDLTGLTENKANMEKQLKETQNMLTQANTHPEKADEIIKKLNSDSTNGGDGQ